VFDGVGIAQDGTLNGTLGAATIKTNESRHQTDGCAQEAGWYSDEGRLSPAQASSNVPMGILDARIESTVPARTELSGETSNVW
jgi:hypothetical protein